MILNLTQHGASDEQVSEGVIEPKSKDLVRDILTFNSIPSVSEIQLRAEKLAKIAQKSGAEAAMIGGAPYLIGGAPYLMGALEKALKEAGVKPVYSFTERKSVETKNPDGSTTKTAIFQHVGWVEV
jgi:hypothetical protein